VAESNCIMTGKKRKREMLRLGAHMSIEGGFHRAVERAGEVGATALQIFVKSARQWAAKPIAEPEAAKFRHALDRSGLAPYTLAHSSYLINLAAADGTLWERSVAALREEVERCAVLGIPGLVLHPGSHVGSGEQAGLERVARALDLALPAGETAQNKGVRVLLEVTAGQGTNLGYRFDHLGEILASADCTERLGICFDTCHALAAGYEFRDASSYAATIGELDRQVGLERLRAFHLNDSQHQFGSRKDRHAHIGQGEVGLEAFRLILEDSRFRELPMVLETPKGKDLAEDRMNLEVLRAMVDRSDR